MTTIADPPPLVKRRRWRRLLFLAVPLVILIGVWTYFYFASDVRLAKVLAETERQDPHWRLEDIQANRAEVPDEENGALVVIAARAKMPARWPVWDMGPPGGPTNEDEPDLPHVLGAMKPNETLTPRERSFMRPEMERAADAIQEARRLVDFKRGATTSPTHRTTSPRS